MTPNDRPKQETGFTPEAKTHFEVMAENAQLKAERSEWILGIEQKQGEISNLKDVLTSTEFHVKLRDSEIAQLKAKVETLREALKMNMDWIGAPHTDTHSFDSFRENAWELGKKALSQTAETTDKP